MGQSKIKCEVFPLWEYMAVHLRILFLISLNPDLLNYIEKAAKKDFLYKATLIIRKEQIKII